MENEGTGGARERILLLFPGALGDAVCIEPAVAFLSARGPIAFWARGGAAEVAHLFPSRPEVGALDARDVARLFAPADDVEATAAALVWLRSYRRVFSWTGAGSGPAMDRFGQAGNCHVAAFPARQGEVHAVDEMLQAVGAPSGGCPRLRRPASSSLGRRLLIHPGSGGREKRAPRSLFVRIAARWHAEIGTSATVVLGPAECSESSWWEERGFQVVLPGNVAQLASELSSAAVYVGNDSGPSHVAAGLGVPSVILFRSTSPDRFGPRGATVASLPLRQDEREVADLAWSSLERWLP